MRHLLLGLLGLLSILPQENFLVSTTGCTRRYLRRINGKCYYFSVNKLNWHGALNNCLRKGLTLADLSNPLDFYGAVGFLSSKGNTEDFWFGGNDLQHEGRFQYISSGRLVKFYGNYSIVEPAEHSDCDDCLEVRIRSNMTVVADDNCLERQYFICSERYCDEDTDTAKPRHHSHEHLHHFHHDIGDGSEDDFGDDETSITKASEGAVKVSDTESKGTTDIATDTTRESGEDTTEPGETGVTGDTKPGVEDEKSSSSTVGETSKPAEVGDELSTPAETTPLGGATPAGGAETPKE